MLTMNNSNVFLFVSNFYNLTQNPPHSIHTSSVCRSFSDLPKKDKILYILANPILKTAFSLFFESFTGLDLQSVKDLKEALCMEFSLFKSNQLWCIVSKMEKIPLIFDSFSPELSSDVLEQASKDVEALKEMSSISSSSIVKNDTD